MSAAESNESWFFDFGWIAALVLSAEGFIARYRTLEPQARTMLLVLPVAFAVVAVLVGGAVFAAHGSRAGRPWYIETYGILAVIAVATLIALGRRLPRRARLSVLTAACAALLLGVTSAEVPLKTGGLIFSELRHHRSLHPTSGAEDFGVTPAMWAGLRWIRAHTGPGAVIAVDTHYLGVDRRGKPTYFYFSAFTERSVYLEGWGYTPSAEALLAKGITAVPPRFAGRYRVNQATFANASPWALESLRHAGVRYVVVDLVHGPPSPALARSLPTVFANRALIVYRL